jgi:Lrp/AsnC family leucine-responsive transcriptional regulator
MDHLDKRIIDALTDDSRLSLKELAHIVGLSSPSTSERLTRLHERGLIRSFTIDVSFEAFAYDIPAIVRRRPLPGKIHIVEDLLVALPELAECDKVTGDDCYIARLCPRSTDHLDQLLERLADNEETSTAIVKSIPVRRRNPPLLEMPG